MLKHLRENVYCRLAPSTVHGVGVFAVRDIPAGVDPRDARDRGIATGSLFTIATMLRLAHAIFGCERSAALLDAIGPVRGRGIEQVLIPAAVVLSAKGKHRWRHLPRRRFYALAMRRFASRQYVSEPGKE